MGTVYLRGSTWWIGFVGQDGRWHYKSAKTPDERQARERLAAIEEELRKGNRLAELGPLSIAEWGERWQALRLARKPRVWNAQSEWRQVELHALGLLVDGERFGRHQVAQVRQRHALAFIRALRTKTNDNDEPLAPRTVANIWGTLHKLFADAVIEELITGNPMVLPDTERPRRVDSKRFVRREAIFTRAEALKLLTDPDLDEDHRLVYGFALLAGLREGEVADRRWCDYDAGAEPLGRLSVHSSYRRRNKVSKETKTEVSREVPVHPMLAALLARWKLSGWEETFGRPPRADDLIVPNRWLRHLTDDNVKKAMRKDFALLGLRWRRYHDMRRTFISLALADGAVEAVLQRVTHGPKGDVISQYHTPSWSALCAAVERLQLAPKPAPPPGEKRHG